MLAVTSNSLPAALTCWTARLSAFLLTGLFALFLFGEEPLPRFFQEPLRVQLIFLGWAIVFAGYFAGWISPVTGGVLVIGALGLMNLVEYTTTGRLLGPAFLLWVVPGFLYLLSAWVESFNRPS